MCPPLQSDFHRLGFHFQLHALILNTIVLLMKWDTKSVHSKDGTNQHVNYFQSSIEGMSFSYVGQIFSYEFARFNSEMKF